MFVARFLCAGVLLGTLLVSGCASALRSAGEALEEGPLPYSVGIFVARYPSLPPLRGASASPGGGAASPSRFLLSRDGFLEAAERRLSEAPSPVCRVRGLSETTLDEALVAARRRNVDLLLSLSFETKREYEDYDLSAGWATLEVLSWLCGGIPSWFVPTQDYLTGSRLRVEAIDVGSLYLRQSGAGAEGGAASEALPPAWEGVVEANGQNVSLWDRSGIGERPLDYLATILLPPMVFSFKEGERLSEELTGAVTGDLGDGLRVLLRRKLLDEEARATLSAVALSPDPRRAVKTDAIRLRIGVASRVQGDVVGMDVHRIAGAGSAGVFRWTAGADDLRKLTELLDGRTDPTAYASFDVPSEIPLAAGENFIKLRILRRDRRVLTRTFVYVR